MRVYKVTSDSEIIGRECAFCGDLFRVEDEVVACPVCQTFHHAECWRFAGNKCARLGCGGRGELTGTKTAPLIQSPVTTASQVVRIRPGDIARTVRAAPRRVAGVGAATAGIWSNAFGSLVLSAVLGLVLGLLYRVVGIGVRWAMDASRFSDTFALEYLFDAGRLSLGWWALGGAIYGLLHHRYLMGKNRTGYQFLRALLMFLYLGTLAYQLGYLMLAPSYRWPTIMWDLPSKVRWLAPILAWGLVVTMAVGALGNYTSKLTVFQGAGGIILLLVVMTLSAYWSATINGLVFGGIGWLVATVIDLSWGGIVWVANNVAHAGWEGLDLSTAWLRGGVAIGTNIGFISGLFAPFRRTNT